MKKKLLAVIALVLVFACCLSVPAFAWDVRSNPVISYTHCNITDMDEDGVITINFTIIAKDICSTIGVSQIDLYESDGTFKKHYYPSAYAVMLTSNHRSYSASVDYPATPGKSYYADVYFYAVCDGVTGTFTDTTPIGP